MNLIFWRMLVMGLLWWKAERRCGPTIGEKQAPNWTSSKHGCLGAESSIHGAMAYPGADSNAATMAEQRDLLAICAAGDSAAMINRPGFTPEVWYRDLPALAW